MWRLNQNMRKEGWLTETGPGVGTANSRCRGYYSLSQKTLHPGHVLNSESTRKERTKRTLNYALNSRNESSHRTSEAREKRKAQRGGTVGSLAQNAAQRIGHQASVCGTGCYRRPQRVHPRKAGGCGAKLMGEGQRRNRK